MISIGNENNIRYNNIHDDQFGNSLIKLIFNDFYYFLLSVIFFINENKINKFRNHISQIITAIICLYLFFKK